MKNVRTITVRSNISLTDDGDKRKIVGIIPYNSRSVDMGFIEVITNTAFNKTLADKVDVKALYNHDDSKVLGRVANGSLTLTNTADGLVCECTLPDTAYARDCYNLIKDNYVNTMSFGFCPIKSDMTNDGNETVKYLREVSLFEVSFAVPFPAYEETNSQSRSVPIDIDALIAIANKQTVGDDDMSQLRTINKALEDFLTPKETTIAAIESTVAEPSEVESYLRSFMNNTK